MARRLTPTEQLDGLDLPSATPFARSTLTERARAAVGSGLFREFWKYTRVDEFISALAEIETVRPWIEGLDQPGIELAGIGNSAPGYPTGPGDEQSTGRFPLADLALMMAGDLLVLRIAGAPAEPIRLTTGDGLTVPLLIVLEPGARATLIEQAQGRRFSNQSLYVQLGERATLEHASTALEPGASHWALTQVRQAAGSSYRRQQYQCGGARRRTETQILLEGSDAASEITGAYLIRPDTHLDQQLVVEHRARDTYSRQKFHGIGAGKGSSIFNGRIHIHPGAPGSDAALSNRNLALHPEAVINTKPELEIYTDDVKCAHGATVGQISEDSLFYLNARGLSDAQARRMLCRAFIRECVEGPLAEPAEAALLAGWSEGLGS